MNCNNYGTVHRENSVKLSILVIHSSENIIKEHRGEAKLRITCDTKICTTISAQKISRKKQRHIAYFPKKPRTLQKKILYTILQPLWGNSEIYFLFHSTGIYVIFFRNKSNQKK